jgi:DNA-directed RNA polymerase subunit omega
MSAVRACHDPPDCGISSVGRAIPCQGIGREFEPLIPLQSFTTTKENMTESRARYTSEDAVNMVGNRFDLVLIASQRVRELKRGHRSTLVTKAGPILTALQEIEQGLVGRDYLKRIRKNA